RDLILERRLVELQVALLHGRAQDDVAADADERRLRPRLQRRHVDLEVLGGRRAAGQPPAALQLVDRERPRVDRVDRHRAVEDAHLALLAGAVAAAGGIDRDPVPGRGVEDGRAGGDADVAAVGAELQPHPPGARGGGCLAHAAPAACAAASLARWAAIQRAPHSSWPSRKSAARTASTHTGARASMIALVRPWLAAMPRNPAPSTWRPGRPNDVFDAPQVMFTPRSSRISRTVSMKSVTARGSAPTGMASGSMTMSSGGMPWSPATETILRASSSRRSGSIGISSSFGSAMTAAPCLATSGRMASSRSSSAVTEFTSALPS